MYIVHLQISYSVCVPKSVKIGYERCVNAACLFGNQSYHILRPCSDFMDMLRRLINYRIIIIIIIIIIQF